MPDVVFNFLGSCVSDKDCQSSEVCDGGQCAGQSLTTCVSYIYNDNKSQYCRFSPQVTQEVPVPVQIRIKIIQFRFC